MFAGLLICGTFCLKRRTKVCHFHSILFSQGVVGRLKQVKNNVRVLNHAHFRSTAMQTKYFKSYVVQYLDLKMIFLKQFQLHSQGFILGTRNAILVWLFAVENLFFLCVYWCKSCQFELTFRLEIETLSVRNVGWLKNTMKPSHLSLVQ